MMDYKGAYQLFVLVHNTDKIQGDVAEVGVYKGGSANLICEANENRILESKSYREIHLFDTFSGLPEVQDKEIFYKGQYIGNSIKVRKLLAEYINVNIYEGVFPETAEPIKNRVFSFVNLDVDISQSVKDGLEFFYPRMSRGGAILIHDYSTSQEIKDVVDGFFKEKPEPIIETFVDQVIIVKN